MANATTTALGQINGSGDTNALFLKVFSNEILATFLKENKMLGLSTVRTIASGKSAQFPVLGTFSAAYHSVGTELVGQATKHNEKIINIDEMLVADAFVAEIDELKNHYDVRSEYAKQLGQSLANAVDKNLLSLAILASQASANLTGGVGGYQITDADANTNADSLIGSIFEAIQRLDENNVPSSDRVAIVAPDLYYQLANVDKLVNRDFSDNAGDFANGTIMSIGGVPVVKSNTGASVFNTDLSAAISGANNTYNGNFTNYHAVVMHKSAIGTVKLKDMVMESTYDPRRLGTLMTARFAMGHGILRPESAVSIKTA